MPWSHSESKESARSALCKVPPALLNVLPVEVPILIEHPFTDGLPYGIDVYFYKVIVLPLSPEPKLKLVVAAQQPVPR